MQEKDLVIAVILAVFLHGGIALVRMSAPQPYPPPQKKTLDISIISEYERKPEVSEIAVDTANRRKNKKRYDPKKDVLKEVTGKRTDIAAKEEGKVDITSEGERAEISEPPPPLQPEPDVGGEG